MEILVFAIKIIIIIYQNIELVFRNHFIVNNLVHFITFKKYLSYVLDFESS